MSAAQTLQRARALLKRGDANGAEKLILATWPSAAEASADGLNLLGQVLVAKRHFAHAAAMFERAAQKTPAAAHFFALGDARMLQGAPHPAADAFAQALALEPDYPNARRAFARVALHAERFSEAEAAARALIAQTPDADAWHILACALRGQQRLAESAAASAEAIKHDPKSPARFDWAVAIGRLGRVEEALAMFEVLAAEGLDAGGLAVNRSAALLELDRAAEAERVLTEAAQRHAADMDLHIALAKARWMNGAGADFTALYEDAIARHPTQALLRAGCIDLLRIAGFAERAEDMLHKGLQRAPGDPILRDAHAVALDEADRLSEALPLLASAVHETPNAPEEMRLRYVTALLRAGRADEALAEIAPQRAAAPLDQHWIALESLALKQSGDPRHAWLCDYGRMVRAFELPVPPGFANIAAFNQALSAALGKLHVARAHPLGQTLRQGTQTTRDLTQVDDPIIRAYLEALREPIAAYIATMIDPDHPWSGRRSDDFKLSGAWSVRLKPGGKHVNHIHPAGWISSSYYVELPTGVAGAADHAGWIKFGEPPKPMPGCGIEKLVEPQVGRLVLFPSYMWHGTIPIASGERLTAPFDVIPA